MNLFHFYKCKNLWLSSISIRHFAIELWRDVHRAKVLEAERFVFLDAKYFAYALIDQRRCRYYVKGYGQHGTLSYVLHVEFWARKFPFNIGTFLGKRLIFQMLRWGNTTETPMLWQWRRMTCGLFLFNRINHWNSILFKEKFNELYRN